MIAIIKYNAGNTKSVENAVKRLGYDCMVTDKKQEIITAEKVIFPGVGRADTAMNYLKATGLDSTIKSLKQPVLGICLGLQLLCKSSEEGTIEGLHIFDVEIKKFPPQDKVPHMGWNHFTSIKGKLFEGISPEDHVYFVHSFYAEISKDTMATCHYMLSFSAALQKNNFYAVQFHTEKSGIIGEQILKNFLTL